METDPFLIVLDLVLPPHSAALVSGPVASGGRFYLRKSQSERNDIWKTNAMEMNAFATALRQRISRPVICPGHFKIEGWRGSDYKRFFSAVIRRYVAEAWFMDGWEFSVGSVSEFGLCQINRIPCYCSNSNPLTHREGTELVQTAVMRIRNHGAEPHLLVAALTALTLLHREDRLL